MNIKARKMKFTDIVGQERVKNMLLRAIESNRLPHAMLFSGIPGTGKKTMAKAMAMRLNCLSPSPEGGCGTCKFCRQISHGNFPDFLVIGVEKGKVSKISIDQIRQIYKRVSFSPIARYRIVVIDQAEDMTDEATNSFLKLLEEPPERNIFILNTTEPLNLLPTVVSRCQNIKFSPIPSSLIADWLIKNRSLDKDTAIVLSKMCNGSIGRAIELMESGYLERRDQWISLLIKIPAMNRQGIYEIMEKDPSTKEEVIEMLITWNSWLRDILVIKETKNKELLINRDLSHTAEKVAERYKKDNLLKAIDLIQKAEKDLYKNRNISLVLKNTLLKLHEYLEAGMHNSI